ncbi:MAG TPA: hydrogenase expression/formation protein HypE [Candidatus Saccharimonadales bacterium]|nr:hydrogenase expression/formation protein HypE [Candidatus Saccharimonadales bacterium]
MILEGPQCPIPISDYPQVLLAHGGGGRLTQMLIERMFLEAFRNPALEPLHDGAVLEVEGVRLALSTDTFVVSPLFFPGGDIGSLAVHGTVNDLAMCGARPLALTAGFVLEEGLPMETLWRVTRSLQAAAREAGVAVVTGDTKVVDRGKGDQIFINTTGLGLVPPGVSISPRAARPGDRVLLSGPLALHGIAIMSLREGLEFETTIRSDSAALHGLVETVLAAAGPAVHVLRDPTRGGLASALNEIAAAAGAGMRLVETAIPVPEEVRGACEILGLDPLYVANEGKCVALVAPESAGAALAAMRAHPLGREAMDIGEVTADHPGQVLLKSRVGGVRVVDMLSGEQLPRIC